MNHLLDPIFPGDGYVYRIPLAPEQQSMCSEPFPVQVLIGGLRQRSAILKVHSRDEPGVRRETSSLKLICRSRPLP